MCTSPDALADRALADTSPEVPAVKALDVMATFPPGVLVTALARETS
jgi:hypothetical protein